MKKLILLIIILFSGGLVFGQDEAIFSHYFVAPIIVNPAYAGFDGESQILFNARAQWTGFPDAPQTIGAQFNTPIGRVFGVGVGLVSESAARMTRLRAKINYGFRFPLSDDNRSTLSVGFSTEFNQQSLGNSTLLESFYELGDNIVESAVDGRNFFDASFGMYGRFYTGDNEFFYSGLSITNLVQTRLDDIVTSAEDQRSLLDHYLFMAGYRFSPNGNASNFYLEPSVMLRQIKDAPFQADINLLAGFGGDVLLAGLSYRSIGGLGITLGTDFGNVSNNAQARASGLRFYYTFDLSTQEFQQFTSGSHEVTLAFGFGNQKKDRNR